MVVRRLLESDVAQVSALHCHAFSVVGESKESLLSEIYHENNRCFVVVNESSEIIGYSTYSFHDASVYWNWMAVRPEALGIGAAKLMLNELEKIASQEAKTTIDLKTRNRFKRALVFYLKNGFDIVNTSVHRDGETMIKLSKKVQ